MDAASGDTFAAEDLLATRGGSVELVGVGRRFERMEIERECVELFITIASAHRNGVSGVGLLLEVRNVSGDKSIEAWEAIGALIQ